MQEKLQFAALGFAVVALTLVFGLAMVLTGDPDDAGQDSQALTVIPLPPFRSAFDHPDIGQEFAVIVVDSIAIPEEEVLEDDIPED